MAVIGCRFRFHNASRVSAKRFQMILRPLLSLSCFSARVAVTAAALLLAYNVRAEPPKAPVPAPAKCKAYGGGSCCDPAVAAHLAREAVFASCGETEATFLGAAEKRAASTTSK